MKTTLRLFVIGLVAAICAAGWLSSSTAQKRRDNFLHSSAAHKKVGCASCHDVPTKNRVTAGAFPDVADYPSHSSCVRCHQSDFFQGNNPAICTICHTNPSPRNGTRFPFPVPSRSQEFTAIFPHSVHQDIIARNEWPGGAIPAYFGELYRRLPGGSLEGILPSAERQQDAAATAGRMPALHGGGAVPAHFVNASFQAAATPADDPPPQFNNCAICHQTPSTLPKFGSRAPVQGQALAKASVDSFAPRAEFFKSSPGGHVSCFGCHYQGQKPIRTDCAGCHRPAAPYVESDVITRYSLKFNHQSVNHVTSDCTTCHVRITQNSDLSTMKVADVPFFACASCHKADLKKETDGRAAAAGKPLVFQCAYCHTPEIGRFEIPASHKPR
jgi:hypothetical protein